MNTCPSCHGGGAWRAECCSGANGCDCHGQPVEMGTCLVCAGSGEVPENISAEQLQANLRSIAGYSFLGCGPNCGPWAGQGLRLGKK